MATLALDPLTEYLRSSYKPDAEFVDGAIEERSMGERDHSDLQSELLALLRRPAYKQYFRCNVELRVQTSERNFRVPDVCLLRSGSPKEQIVHTPPLLCIEILSPEDTMTRTLKRVREYLAMGVAEVWVFDAEARTVQQCVGDRLIELSEGELTVPETPVKVDVQGIFRVLDEG
jgi:Uma2 family endonuclease